MQETLAHYRVDERLGAGGMGVVFRAHDLRLRRDVALKVLSEGRDADAQSRARLLREARLASSLNHPHICHIYEVGEAEGHDYIAMELVRGRSLRSLIPQGGLSSDVVIRHGIQIADALAHAHEHGVLHRDLKTENVVITPEGVAKVLDFGLAKRLDVPRESDVTTEPTLTPEGAVAGTPRAMAPEVLSGTPADPRSDIWALGVLLHETAGGAQAFQGRTHAELFSAILRGQPNPLPCTVPAGLQSVIRRCLAKEPTRRYRSAREVQASLEALLVESGSRPVVTFPPKGSWLVATLLGLTVLAAVVVLDLGGVRERIWGGDPQNRAGIRSLAVLPLANHSGDAAQDYFADGMTEELITDLASIQSLKVISRTSVMRFKGTRKSIPEIARELGVDGVVEGSVMRAEDRVRITAQLIDAPRDRHLWAQSFERDASDVLGLQREVAREIADQINLRLSPQESARLGNARSVNPQANDLYLNGRYHWSQLNDSGVRRSIELYRQAIALDSLDARPYSGLADAYLFLAQVVGTMTFPEALPKVQAYAAKAVALDDLSPEAHISMGMALLWGRWNWGGAERHMKRAIQLNPGLDGAHLAYATLLGASGRADEAVRAARRGYDLSPLSQISGYGLTRELFQSRRYGEALELAKRSLEIGPVSPFGLALTARIYEQMGRYADAIEEQRPMLSPQGAESLRQGFTENGEQGYWRANLRLALGRRSGRPVSATRMAHLYSKVGDSDRAFQWLETALRDREGDCLFLRSSPSYEELRRDARFARVARRLGLRY